MAQFRLRQPEDKFLSRWGFLKPYRPVLNPQHPINKDLQGCWMLGDSALGPFTDLTGNGNTGNSESVGEPPTPSHHRGYAAFFNPSFFDAIKCGSSLRLTGNYNASGSALTISCWVNFNGTGAFSRIISMRDAGGANGYELLAYDLSANPGWVVVKGGVVNGISSSIFLTRDKWHHMVATYDNVSLKLWIDTVMVASNAVPNALGTCTSQFCIGGTNSGSNYFGGGIEGVRVFSRVIAQEEILQLFVEPYAGINDAIYDRKIFGIPAPPAPTGPYQQADIWG